MILIINQIKLSFKNKENLISLIKFILSPQSSSSSFDESNKIRFVSCEVLTSNLTSINSSFLDQIRKANEERSIKNTFFSMFFNFLKDTLYTSKLKEEYEVECLLSGYFYKIIKYLIITFQFDFINLLFIFMENDIDSNKDKDNHMNNSNLLNEIIKNSMNNYSISSILIQILDISSFSVISTDNISTLTNISSMTIDFLLKTTSHIDFIQALSDNYFHSNSDFSLFFLVFLRKINKSLEENQKIQLNISIISLFSILFNHQLKVKVKSTDDVTNTRNNISKNILKSDLEDYFYKAFHQNTSFKEDFNKIVFFLKDKVVNDIITYTNTSVLVSRMLLIEEINLLKQINQVSYISLSSLNRLICVLFGNVSIERINILHNLIFSMLLYNLSSDSYEFSCRIGRNTINKHWDVHDEVNFSEEDNEGKEDKENHMKKEKEDFFEEDLNRLVGFIVLYKENTYIYPFLTEISYQINEKYIKYIKNERFSQEYSSFYIKKHLLYNQKLVFETKTEEWGYDNNLSNILSVRTQNEPRQIQEDDEFDVDFHIKSSFINKNPTENIDQVQVDVEKLSNNEEKCLFNEEDFEF